VAVIKHIFRMSKCRISYKKCKTFSEVIFKTPGGGDPTPQTGVWAVAHRRSQDSLWGCTRQPASNLYCFLPCFRRDSNQSYTGVNEMLVLSHFSSSPTVTSTLSRCGVHIVCWGALDSWGQAMPMGWPRSGAFRTLAGPRTKKNKSRRLCPHFTLFISHRPIYLDPSAL
jgi:hypothetical protein